MTPSAGKTITSVIKVRKQEIQLHNQYGVPQITWLQPNKFTLPLPQSNQSEPKSFITNHHLVHPTIKTIKTIKILNLISLISLINLFKPFINRQKGSISLLIVITFKIKWFNSAKRIKIRFIRVSPILASPGLRKALICKGKMKAKKIHFLLMMPIISLNQEYNPNTIK